MTKKYKEYKGIAKIYEDGTIETTSDVSVNLTPITYGENKEKEKVLLSYAIDGRQYMRTFSNLMFELFEDKEIKATEVISFKDGNALNCSMDNMEVISKSDKMREVYRNREKNPCPSCENLLHRKFEDGEICGECRQSLKLAQRKLEKQRIKIEKIREEMKHLDVSKLSEIEKTVMEGRLEGKTYQEIGDMVGNKRQYIQQVYSRLVKKSNRNKLNEQGTE